jgi:FkbM family methyltransferase
MFTPIEPIDEVSTRRSVPTVTASEVIGTSPGLRRRAFQRIADGVISLVARKRLYRFWSFVHEVSLHGMGVLNCRPSTTGEAAFLQSVALMASEIPGPHCVVDVGANVGNYAADARAALPHARIVCLEPHPRTVAALRTRAAELRLDVVAKAAGREAGEMELHDWAFEPEGTEHATFYRDVIVTLDGYPSTSVRVPVTTVDAVMTERGIDRVLLLKIDTEGHELAVLQGASASLSRGAIEIVQLEFNEMNVISRTFFRDLLDPLAGYRIFRMLPDGLVLLDYSPRKSEIFGFQNLVAIRQDLARSLRV